LACGSDILLLYCLKLSGYLSEKAIVPTDGTLTVDCSADLIVIDLLVCPPCKARVLLYFLKDHVS
jgi:hypothetical protein